MFITLSKLLHPKEKSLTKTKYVDEFAKYRIIQLFDSVPIDKEIIEYYQDFIYYDEYDNRYFVLEYIKDLKEFENDITSLIVPATELKKYLSTYEFDNYDISDKMNDEYIILID